LVMTSASPACLMSCMVACIWRRRASLSIATRFAGCAPIVELAEDGRVAGGVELGKKRQQVGDVEKVEGETRFGRDVLAVFVEGERLQRLAVESPHLGNPQAGV